MYIGIKEIGKVLNYKDSRSIRKWCKKRYLKILNDPGTKRYYILRHDFERARHSEAMNYLRAKYGVRNFPEVFNSFQKLGVEYAQMPIKVKNYKAEGEHEKRFKSILLSMVNELQSSSNG